MGRHSTFDWRTADAICERLADGESLRNISTDPEMPSRQTVRRWLSDFPEFRVQYARARVAQADALAEEAVAVATGSDDSRLQYDALRWYASKLSPKVYGEKVEAEVTTRHIISEEPMDLDEWSRKYGNKDEG